LASSNTSRSTLTHPVVSPIAGQGTSAFGRDRGRHFHFLGEVTMHETVIDLIEQVLGWNLPETAITDALHFRVPELAGW
jgi:hypothetical protein